MNINKRRMASLNKLALRNIVLVPIRAFTVSSAGKSISSKLHPWFVSGFVDGEGCFELLITKNSKYRCGYQIQLMFTIVLDERDEEILKQIKEFFGVGNITTDNGRVRYRVSSKKDLVVIIEFFKKYPLKTQKLADYLCFRDAYDLYSQGKHLTNEGFIEILKLKANINKGLSKELNKAFPNIKPVVRPEIKNQIVDDPNWLAGFTSGEGNFGVWLLNSKKSKLGVVVQLQFSISQHLRDLDLINSFIDIFKCGNLKQHVKYNAIEYRVTNFSDITDKIISFFSEYPIIGVKAKDFSDFCEVAKLMENKTHLTKEGLEVIRIIKSGMNLGRKD